MRFPALFSEKQSQSENGSHVHTLVYSLQATESTGVVSTVSGAGRWRACHVVCVTLTACATVSRFGVVCVCVILVSDPCVQEHHDTHSHSHLMLERLLRKQYMQSLLSLGVATTVHGTAVRAGVSQISITLKGLSGPVHVYEAADPDRLLLEHERASGESDVYGACLWPSSYVAARNVVEEVGRRCGTERVRVVELGCGPGLPSLAALAAGANEVLACDWSPLALDLVACAALDHQALRASCLRTERSNLLSDAPMPWEPCDPQTVLVCADLLYEAATARAVGRCVARAVSEGATCIVADPGRMNGKGRELLLQEMHTSSGDAEWSRTLRFLVEPISQADLRRCGASLSWCGRQEDSVGLLRVSLPSPCA